MTKEQADLTYRLALECQMNIFDLCQELVVSRQTYYRWMAGKRKMQGRNEAKVRAYLDKVRWMREFEKKYGIVEEQHEHS
jgi:hypothetical protein